MCKPVEAKQGLMGQEAGGFQDQFCLLPIQDSSVDREAFAPSYDMQMERSLRGMLKLTVSDLGWYKWADRKPAFGSATRRS